MTPEQERELLNFAREIAEKLQVIAKWYKLLEMEEITPPEIPSAYTIGCPNCGQPMQETEVSYACKDKTCGHVMKKTPYIPPRPSETPIPETNRCPGCGGAGIYHVPGCHFI